MASITKHSVVTAVLCVAAATLLSAESAAEKNFTMKMEDGQRAKWDKGFNELLSDPFGEKLSCPGGTDLKLPAGEGCVEISSDQKICCKEWTLKLTCRAGNWTQTGIEGAACKRRPIK